MKQKKFIKPWHGTAVRHIPDGNDVLDFSLCGLSSENRWNLPGEPTLYLAGSKQVALGEYSRHYKENRSPKLYKTIQKRRIWNLELSLNKTVDLCDPLVFGEFPDAPGCFKNIKNARSVVALFRNMYKVEAVFVPSMVFLDDLTKWCLVLFLENLPLETDNYIVHVKKEGYFQIT